LDVGITLIVFDPPARGTSANIRTYHIFLETN